MNFKKLIFLFTLALATISCSSDDDGPGPYVFSNDNLSGNYKTTLLTGDIEQTYTVNGTEVKSVTKIIGDTFQMTTVFGANGSYSASGQYRIETKITTAGNTTTDSEIIVVEDEGTYSISPDKKRLTITIDGDAETFDVSLFNETKLNLKREINETINDVPTVGTFKVNYERI